MWQLITGYAIKGMETTDFILEKTLVTVSWEAFLFSTQYRDIEKIFKFNIWQFEIGCSNRLIIKFWVQSGEQKL